MTPDNLYYTEEHEWIRIENDVAWVGITDFAQGELDEIVYVELEVLDEEVSKGDTIGSIEAVKTTSDIYAPLSGLVVAVNEDLAGSPELVNSDPYGEGWMLKLKISDQSEIESLLEAEGYEKMIK